MNKFRVCLSIIGLTTTGLLSNAVTKKATAKTIEPPTSNQNWNAKLKYRQTNFSLLSARDMGLNTRYQPSSFTPINTSKNSSIQPINRTFNSVYDIAQRRNSQPAKISYRAADLSLQTAQNIPVPSSDNLPVIPPEKQYQSSVDNTGVQPEANSSVIPSESKYQTDQYQTNQYQTNQYQTEKDSNHKYYTEKSHTENYQTDKYQADKSQTNQYQTNQSQQPTYNNAGYSDSSSKEYEYTNQQNHNHSGGEYQYKEQKFQVKPIEPNPVKSAGRLRVTPIIGDDKFAGVSAHQEEITSHYEDVEICHFETKCDEHNGKKDNRKWTVTPEIGTLGAGFSFSRKINSNFDARIGFNAGSIGIGEYKNDNGKGKDDHDDHDGHEGHDDHDDHHVSYDSDLNLFNISTLVDYRPFKDSGFHLTTGFVFNDNHVESDAKLKHDEGDYFAFNGNHYTHDDISAVKGKVSFPNKIAPYLGIGWKKPVKYGQRWGFAMNLGVMFPGAPNVELTPTIGNEGLSEQILADMKAEEKAIEDDLKGFGVYPVASVGVSYHF